MKILTFTAADGFQGTLSGPQLANESDADFATRLTAMLPAGATNPQLIDAADYVPPVSHDRPTPREWLERLSDAKQAAIAAAGVGNGTILLWLLKAAGTPTIDVTSSETVAGVAALVTAGVLTTADQAVLLAP
jgi:hypothetical protein